MMVLKEVTRFVTLLILNHFQANEKTWEYVYGNHVGPIIWGIHLDTP